MKLKLNELRQTRTKKQQAFELGIEEKTYANYENGITEPNLTTLIKLADYFNVSLDYLCGHETKHLIDTSMWDESKKAIVNIVEQLTLQNSYMVLGYVSHILKQQNE